MPEHLQKILDVIREAIRERYTDDIAVMILYGSAINGTADELSDLDIFYIPKTPKGCNLAKTFILDGIGYDIWCGSWDALYNMMAWKDMRVSILADSVLIHAASEEDRQKYETMRENARQHTTHPTTAHDYHPALEFVQSAKNYYGWLCLGNQAVIGEILLDLANAVCYVNRRYLKYGAKKIPDELAAYPLLPENFTENYRRAVREPENALSICKDMILSTEEFVHSNFSRFTGKDGLASHCTGLYEEISSHWNKIRRCCEANDPDGALLAAASLQYNLDFIKITVGHAFDLMTAWNPRDLASFRRHCDAVEQDLIRTLRENDVPLCSLDSAEQLKQLLIDSYDVPDSI